VVAPWLVGALSPGAILSQRRAGEAGSIAIATGPRTTARGHARQGGNGGARVGCACCPRPADARPPSKTNAQSCLPTRTKSLAKPAAAPEWVGHPTESSPVCQVPFAGPSSPAAPSKPPPRWVRTLCRCSGFRCDWHTAQVRYHARQVPAGTEIGQEPGKRSRTASPPSGDHRSASSVVRRRSRCLPVPVPPRSAAVLTCDRWLPASRPPIPPYR